MFDRVKAEFQGKVINLEQGS